MRNILTLALVIAGLTLGACGGMASNGASAENDGSSQSSGDSAQASEELPAAPTVTGAEARALVAAGAVLLDVTPNRRAADSLIEGRTHIPFPELSERMHELPQETPIVVYCFGGRASPGAGAQLQAAGYDARVMGAKSNWDEVAPADEQAAEESTVEN